MSPSMKLGPTFDLQVALALSLNSSMATGGGHSPFVQSIVFGLFQAPALGESLGWYQKKLHGTKHRDSYNL